MKIQVPKYGFEYFCRIEKGDFTPGREDDMLELFTPEKGSVVVEAGAHIGRYTIVSSKRVGPEGKVIAIEPDPNSYVVLVRNVQLNGLTNVLPLNCTAYSEETNVRLYEPDSNFSIYDTIMPAKGREQLQLCRGRRQYTTQYWQQTG